MEEQKEQTAKEPAAGAQPGFGKLLRSLREKAGLSLDDVANRTKISRGQLEAMEREEMRLLPEPVYVRAFIRDICRVMGTDPKPVTDAFAREFAPETPAAQAPEADAVPARKMEKEVEFHASPRKKGFRVFLAFAVVIVLIGAVWGGWREGILAKLGGDNTEAAQVQMQEASGRTAALQRPRSPSSAMPANAPLTANPDGTASVPDTAASSPAASSPAAAAQTAAASAKTTDTAAAPAGTGNVTIRTIGSSWVKLIDADGKTIFQGNIKAGDEKSFTGKLPIRATVGNSTQCAVSLNGTPFDLSGYTKGSVARFILQ